MIDGCVGNNFACARMLILGDQPTRYFGLAFLERRQIEGSPGGCSWLRELRADEGKAYALFAFFIWELKFEKAMTVVFVVVLGIAMRRFRQANLGCHGFNGGITAAPKAP